MLDTLRPAHVRDVNEAVDPRFNFNKGSKARQIPNLAIDTCSDWILQRQHHPRILFGLFHTERDLFLVRIDLEHDRLDRLANRDELRRMADVARPAHLADVHEPLDSGLQLDKSAVVRDRDDLTRHARPDRILLGNVLPRIALELLETETDALARPVDVEHLDLELRTDRHELRRMRDTSPRHIGDVQQAVDAA